MSIYNLEAERSLLGSILSEQGLIKEISLHPLHFYEPRNQLIYEAMKKLDQKNKPHDIVHVATELGSKADEVGGVSYIADLVNSVPTVTNFKHYEKLVMDSWKLRESVKIVNTMKEEVSAASDVWIISKTISDLSKLDEAGSESEFNLHDTIHEIYNELDQDSGELNGVDTGYYDLNAYTNGWQNGDLVIVGARPSVGKTAFALNMAIAACEKGAVTSIFSLEMSRKSLLKRILSQVGRIDANRMRNPSRLLDEADRKRLSTATGTISELPLFIYDKPSVTVQEIRAKLRSLKRKYPNQKHLCVIDYLQLIQGSGHENRVLEMGEISRGLKLMARDFDMPIIALSQLSRLVESRKEKKPMLSDLRESGNIEQDADVILFLYRDDYYNQKSENPNTIEIMIAKQRNGATGTIELVFLKEFNKFENKFRRK